MNQIQADISRLLNAHNRKLAEVEKKGHLRVFTITIFMSLFSMVMFGVGVRVGVTKSPTTQSTGGR